MHTQSTIIAQIADLKITPTDTLLIHSSLRAIGRIEGGAETVLDAFSTYLARGLLVFPTHTWAQMSAQYNVFDPLTEPSCVGALTNLFLKRPGVLRSWHPTHSVAALGRDAAGYLAGEEQYDSPCPRGGCWGKLYDRQAKILFIGCSLKTNTIIHGVEEWNGIPHRLAAEYLPLKIRTPAGRLLECPMRSHFCPQGEVSRNYDKLERPLLHTGIATKGHIGDAVSLLCDVQPLVELAAGFLKRNPGLFIDNTPVPAAWYDHRQK